MTWLLVFLIENRHLVLTADDDLTTRIQSIVRKGKVGLPSLYEQEVQLVSSTQLSVDEISSSVNVGDALFYLQILRDAVSPVRFIPEYFESGAVQIMTDEESIIVLLNGAAGAEIDDFIDKLESRYPQSEAMLIDKEVAIKCFEHARREWDSSSYFVLKNGEMEPY
jgi:hypothetical protein